MTDRFAIETLEISGTDGTSEYWSLVHRRQIVLVVGLPIRILTDVSNTGKGILIGSDAGGYLCG